MVRFFVPALVILLAGCCHQPGVSPWTNPFDYNSRIAPPATGTAVPNGSGPYYAPSTGQPPPVSQPPPGTQGNATSEPTPAVAKVKAPASTSSTGFREVGTTSAEPGGIKLASHTETPKSSTTQPIRVVKQSAQTLASTTLHRSRSKVTNPPRDITTLPPADRPISKNVGDESRRPVREPRKVFGYKADYSTLEGRLEYSAAADQWKLRYIPIDGKTDRFGGSVVLVEKDRMADFEDGDFVTIQGELGRDGQDAIGYAPAYHLDQIRRL